MPAGDPTAVNMDPHSDHKEFERFVRQNADQYRLYPSERVWNGIHDTLHGRRRRYALALVALLVFVTVGAWMMFSPAKDVSGTAGGMNGGARIARYEMPEQSFAKSPKIPVASPNAATILTVTFNRSARGLAVQTDRIPAKPSTDGTPVSEKIIGINELPSPATQDQPTETTTAVPPVLPGSIADGTITSNDTPPPAAFNPSGAEKTAAALKEFDPSLKSEKTEIRQPQQPVERPVIEDKKILSGRAASRLSWQLYMIPTVSYRTLSENTTYISAALFNSVMNGTGASFTIPDVDDMVYHRPDMGFQLGIQASTPLSPWLRVTGGLQLGVSKYNIQAYKHTPELATIMLTDRSVTTVTQYRNAEGLTKNWLRNFYFSASLPIGLELKLSDGDRNYFGVAGSLQPTYVIDNRSYLITADFKNYAEMPSLLRRWNMNTSFEIFAQQTTGKVQWRVGPQIRYQAFSSFSRNYPIKEHLFDFGIKLGVQLR